MAIDDLVEMPMKDPTSKDPQQARKGMHIAMMACCAVMLLPVAGLFLSQGGVSIASLAPLLLCVGAHLMMHKFLGKNCHTESRTEKTESGLEDQSVMSPSDVPQVTRA